MDACPERVQGVRDTQDLIGGKWKIVILAALYINGKFRFMDLA